jgi:hypothetical protein|tara:strand:- start:8975 stop:9205 length:231 start_codon:yes stop_codon:yes gene_type:complete
MDARASERGGCLARSDVARVFADVFGRVDVGVDARRRDGDADRVDRDDAPWGARRRGGPHVRVVDDEFVGGGDKNV